MATERERKFLVTGEAWRAQVVSERAIRQAYLASTPHAAIRIRISDDSKAVLTIKSAEPGIERSEFEYAVPLVDAEAMIVVIPLVALRVSILPTRTLPPRVRSVTVR